VRNPLNRRLASLLLVLVVTTHYAYAPLSEFYGNPQAASKAIFYILRGVEGFILYAVVWSLSRGGIAVALACGWGMLESAQTSICRMAIGIERTATASPYSGLCDVVTGLPVYALTMVAALIVASFIQGHDDARG
jgi:hypothetical protein